MAIALLAMAGGLALGWISTWFAGISSARMPAAIEHLWVVPVTLAAQIAWAKWLSALPGSTASLRLVVPASTVALLLMVLSNWEWPAARLVALGIALNLAVIVANGNLMPVSLPDAVASVPSTLAGGLSEGQPVPTTKDVVVDPSRTRLRLLSDHLALRLPLRPTHTMSPGDLVITAGLAWWIAQFTRRSLLNGKGSRWLRTPGPAGSSSSPATTV